MINSFQSLNSITTGLRLLQLEQNINATNLSDPSVDSQGYLMSSLERANSVNNPSLSFTGANGLLSVGTGTSVSSITRLRNLYLDNQIQKQSTTVGYNEILSNFTQSGVMDQINNIVNGTTTLNSTLSSFTAAWSTLASTAPSSASYLPDQSAVVQAGVKFASAANSQYSQLQNLQLGMNSQIQGTVGQINQLLQQLGSVNQQLLASGGSNQSSLLDARDYALDKLSRLTNFQVTFASTGAANVWMNSVELVNENQVSQLQAQISNPNHPQLVDITLQNAGGTFSTANGPIDITSLVTGGNLGGELYASNVVLQSYLGQVDQIATSVLNLTNNIYQAGYVYNSTSTGTAFFTGSSAGSIQVNGVLTGSSAVSPFLQTELTQNNTTGAPTSTVGLVSTMLSNMGSLLANNYVQSVAAINSGAQVDPTKTLAVENPFFATPPSPNPEPPATFQFTINGVKINYTTNNSINDILNSINTQLNSTGVYAVFNYSTQEFYIFSSGSINVQENGTDNFTTWADIKNVLVSSIAMNQGALTQIAPNGVANDAMNATLPQSTSKGPNNETFFLTPAVGGSFSLTNGVTTYSINWANTQSLTAPANSIANSVKTATANAVTVSFAAATQYLTFQSSSPMKIYDNSGNFTVFSGLNNTSTSTANLALNLLTESSAQQSTYQTAYTSSVNSLTQLNNQQDNLAGVAGTYTVNGTTEKVGVSVDTIQQQAMQDMIQFNAMLEMMQTIDQMLGALVGISSSTSSNGIFAQQSQG